jgi:MFS transporter, DHA2 family, multidrug resistance protein
VIGSVHASLYVSRVTERLPAPLPGDALSATKRSIGGAMSAAEQLTATGHAALAAAVRDIASDAFFHGFEVAVLVAAAIALVGAAASARLVPSQPPAGGLP